MFDESLADPAVYWSRLFWSALWFTLGITVAAGVLCRMREHLTERRIAAAFRGAFTLLLYTIVAALVLGTFATRWGFRGDSPHWGLEKMLAYEARQPFAYRVLSPTLINAGISIVPRSYVERHREWFLEETPVLRYRHRNESWDLDKSVAWHVAYLYLFLSLMIALYAARAVTREAGPGPPLLSDTAPAIGVLFLPMSFLFGGYLYDFAELAFLFVCLLTMLRSQWALYYLAFVLALLNKESNILIVVYFAAICWDRVDRRQLVAHLGAQLLIGAIILIALRIVFSDNGGGPAEFWMSLNALFWLQPETYLRFDRPYAALIPTPRSANLISLFLVSSIVVIGWRACPPTLRRLALFSAAVNIPLFLIWGFLDEIRNLSLTFPALYLLGCYAIPQLWTGASDGRR